MDSFAELQKVGVVVLAVLDRLVLRVEGLLGAVVRKSLAVVRQEGLRRVATGERLEKNSDKVMKRRLFLFPNCDY